MYAILKHDDNINENDITNHIRLKTDALIELKII